MRTSDIPLLRKQLERLIPSITLWPRSRRAATAASARNLVALILLAVGTLVFSAASAAPSSGLVVLTTSGAVGGILDGSAKEWQGIPYAAPPVGALR